MTCAQNPPPQSFGGSLSAVPKLILTTKNLFNQSIRRLIQISPISQLFKIWDNDPAEIRQLSQCTLLRQ